MTPRRLLFASLCAASALAIVAPGCQSIAGISDLSVTGGAAATGGGGVGGAGGGTGGADGKELGASCGAGDECASGFCADGVCCDDACEDRCSSRGDHETRSCAEGTCTTDSVDDCGLAACDDEAGCGAGRCDDNDDCGSAAFCEPGMDDCVACGFAPGMGAQCNAAEPRCEPGCQTMGCATCEGTTCAVDCTGCAGGLVEVGGMMMGPGGPTGGANVIRCPNAGDCADTTINCFGPWPCTVECGPGACDGLQLLRPNEEDGAELTLECTGAGSCEGATVACGRNRCTVTCEDPGVTIQQTCGQSCDCNDTGPCTVQQT